MQVEYNISAILLAAGHSNRFVGENKLLLPFADGSIIGTTAAILTALPILEIIVVTGHEAVQVKEILKRYRIKFAHNTDFAHGMASSIRIGVASADLQTDGFLICPADMPFLKTEFLMKLCRAFTSGSKSAITFPVICGEQRNPVIFSSRYRNDLLRSIGGDKGARSIIRAHPDEALEVPVTDPLILQDIDTLEDYRKYAQKR